MVREVAVQQPARGQEVLVVSGKWRAVRGSDVTRGRGREECGMRWWPNKTQMQQPTREQEGSIKRLVQQEAKALAH